MPLLKHFLIKHLIPPRRMGTRFTKVYTIGSSWIVLLLLIASIGMGQSSQDRPNIIFIMVDHMRPDYLIGNKTPHLTNLARNGVEFIHAYTASPLCQPSRTSIITGLYPSQTGIYGNQTGPITDDLRDHTFMNVLKENGYYTSFIGKHHYIDRYAMGINMVVSDKTEVEKYGFDHVVQVADIGEHMPNPDHSENMDDYIYYLREKGLEETYFDNIRDGIKQGIHPLKADDTEDGFIGNQAIDFIQNYEQSKPFYLGISFIGPHPPYVVPEEWIRTDRESTRPVLEGDDNANLQLKRARYTDMITLIDHYIGKIVDALKDKGVFENTTIVFTSDHGDNLGDYGIWDKRYFYENSVGVPLVLSGGQVPGRDVRIGTIRSKALVSTLDIYPTILSLAGVDIPDHIPGNDLMEVIHGDPYELRDAVYSQLGTLVMVRTARWKMVFDPEQGGAYFLFNLVNYPQEIHNLAGVAGYETVTATLTEILMSYYIGLYQSTQMKEQLRLQKVRVGQY